MINLCDQLIFKKSGERVGLGWVVMYRLYHNTIILGRSRFNVNNDDLSYGGNAQ